MSDQEEIRKEIAIEHNVLLGKDDPVLMLVTLHEKILQLHMEALSKKNKEYLEELKVAQQKGIADAKLSAGRIITDASNYVSEQVNTAVKSALGEVKEEIRKDMRESKLEVHNTKISAMWAAGIGASIYAAFLGWALMKVAAQGL